MKRPVVGLTQPIHPDGMALLQAKAEARVAHDIEPDTLRALAAECDGLITRTLLPPDILEGGRLKVVVRHGIGVDFIPVARATELGVPVANVPGATTEAMAEMVVGMTLALARKLVEQDRRVRAGEWGFRLGLGGFELRGREIAIVGLGRSGTRTAEILAHGFGARVLAVTRRPAEAPPFVVALPLQEAAERCDVLSLHAPAAPETRHLVNEALLRRMRPTALLVNTTRGDLVDEAALARALKEGWIAGAALDVLQQEPPRGDHPLFALPNVLLAAHTAGLTVESERELSLAAVREALRVLVDGQPPLNLVNPAYRDRR
jgi:D-3-phosphoglycerate dehydrogenase / 2-oxoglutarate reductase